MRLRIPPADRVLYQWKTGDDLSSVAEKYSIDPESIAQWEGNELDYEEYLETGEIKIMPGQYIFIPQGIRPLENWLWIYLGINLKQNTVLYWWIALSRAIEKLIEKIVIELKNDDLTSKITVGEASFFQGC